MTKPQDVVVALKLHLDASQSSYAGLAAHLCLSVSEVHGAVKRLEFARLIEAGARRIRRQALAYFVIFGVPYTLSRQAG